MTQKNAEKEVLELERKYWQALQDKDVDTALELTDDPCIVTGAQGVGRMDKQAMQGMLSAAPWTLEKFQVKDPEVRMLSDDVAIVAYKVREELTVDGEPVTLEASDASTWVRRDGQWVCALHTEALTGDPFGRDRQQAPS